MCPPEAESNELLNRFNKYEINREYVCVKYIYSDAILFVKKNINFYAANSAMLYVKFTSSLMEQNNGK